MVKAILRFLWFARRRVPLLRRPLIWPLPYGGRFHIYPDETGLNVIRGCKHEEGAWKFAERFLKPGMTCVDVGANQGFYTILMRKKVGDVGQVFAFEPSSLELMKLFDNLSLNNLNSGSCYITPLALSYHIGKSRYYENTEGHASRSSLAPLAKEVRGKVLLTEVGTTTLDFLKGTAPLTRLDLLKIDTEGAELEVLRGARRTLKELKPTIIIEIADVCTRQFGYPSSYLVTFLEDHGYQVFYPGRRGLVPYQPTDDNRDTVVALPNEHLDRILDSLVVK
ncbi:hypothetical protein LCGC14_1564570 [marine sediment metagenome]|uniref:Methyltransferase FkbM domain-containing protein n=1 Tax=marine sediment metagenome TaxID=412755 RepID=A0A0F9ILF1_9ZZZZ